MPIPDSLTQKIALFKESGKVHNANEAWQQVMIGQGVLPKDYHPLADALSSTQLAEYHGNVKSIINQVVAKLPKHQDFLEAVNNIAHP